MFAINLFLLLAVGNGVLFDDMSTGSIVVQMLSIGMEGNNHMKHAAPWLLIINQEGRP